MVSQSLCSSVNMTVRLTKSQQNDPGQIISNPKFLKQNCEICINHSNWSYLIRNYLSQGAPREALLLYTKIHRKGIYSLGAFPVVLKACASLSLISHGKALHAEAIKLGFNLDIMVGTSLVDMYSKCNDIHSCSKVFDYMPQRNAVTWNAMISGYFRNKDTKAASLLFERMIERTAVTWSQMIEGFSKIGDIATARGYFDRVPLELKNVVTWTVMVDAYTSNGEMEEARKVFEEMGQRNCFVWSSMICGYFKKGNIEEAKAIFDRIPVRNLVNWNSLISGYTQNGYCEEALEAFSKMQTERFEPDEVTIVSVLSVCAQLGLLDMGRQIHSMTNSENIKLNGFVLNGLVDMYAKCGDLSNAKLIFEKIVKKENACWNSMIAGFAIHGQCRESLQLFNRMKKSNKNPDDITFLSVLSACSHGGFLKEGLEIFSKMKEFGLTPGIKHYGCLVDLLGRAGKLKETYELIKQMPMKPNDTIWGSFLGACRVHSDAKMAEMVLKEVEKQGFQSGFYDNSHYVMISSIYAASERWEKVEMMRVEMINKGFRKIPGSSSVIALVQ